MKKALIITLVILAVTTPAIAKVGIGVQLGIPTGITAKFWLDRTSAIDLTAGWDIYDESLVLQAGYLYHFPIPVSSGSFAFYVGAGGLLGIDAGRYDEELYLAGRIPLGLEYIYNPISLYAELDPLIRLIPNTDLDIGGGLGFRFYF